jgi:hypothetical protein
MSNRGLPPSADPFPRPNGDPNGDPHKGTLSPFPRPPAAVDSAQKGTGAENTLSPFPLSPILNIDLPATFDKWRQEGYLAPPSDQAKCGACYAFAAVGQLADRISIATRRQVRHNLSTQFVVSCLQSRFQYGCGGTLDVPPIYLALMPGGFLGGTYRQYVFPYSGQQWDPRPDKDPKSPCYYTPDARACQVSDDEALALPTHCYPPRPKTGMACTGTVPCNIAYISRWYPDEKKYTYSRVLHLSENTNAGHLYPGRPEMEHYRLSIPVPMKPQELRNNVRRIKEAIYLYGPVTAVIPIYKDFNEKFKPGTLPWNDPNYVYEVGSTTLGGAPNTMTGLHHVLLVGWGRDARGEYWVVKNSWGVWWNYDGYFNARMGDPRLLTESNCHSAIPYNPLTGYEVGSFDHSKKDSRLAKVFALVLIVLLILVSIRLAMVNDIKAPKDASRRPQDSGSVLRRPEGVRVGAVSA